MSYEWIRENPAVWDEDKQRIVGGAAAGIFGFQDLATGDLVPGEWWHVESEGAVIGFGWMDCNWGDAEILLAVEPGLRKQGAGTFILDQLEHEAAERGVNYILNEVKPTHPDPEGITRWLGARGFARSHDDRLLRRAVKGAVH